MEHHAELFSTRATGEEPDCFQLEAKQNLLQRITAWADRGNEYKTYPQFR